MTKYIKIPVKRCRRCGGDMEYNTEDSFWICTKCNIER